MINECCIFISSQFRRGQQLIGMARLLHLYHNVASVPPIAILSLQDVCRGALTAATSPQLRTSARPLWPRVPWFKNYYWQDVASGQIYIYFIATII